MKNLENVNLQEVSLDEITQVAHSIYTLLAKDRYWWSCSTI